MSSPNSSVELCRKNGWGVGTVLEGEENGRIDRITITYLSDETLLARWYWSGKETLTTLMNRDWKKVADPEPAPKTVQCRIALAVDEYGRWMAAGSDEDAVEDLFNEFRILGCIPRGQHIITVEVPIPEVGEIAATAEPVDGGESCRERLERILRQNQREYATLPAWAKEAISTAGVFCPGPLTPEEQAIADEQARIDAEEAGDER